MPNFKKLDERYALQPWSNRQHADFVAGQYGSLLAFSRSKADAYLKAYQEKETEFDAAHESQNEFLRRSQTMLGQEPQSLPQPKKLDWNPRKRFEDAQQDAPRVSDDAVSPDGTGTAVDEPQVTDAPVIAEITPKAVKKSKKVPHSPAA